MRKLSEQEFERITSLLRDGKPLPEDYKAYLFDTKKEYELIYADKEREEDILADTMAAPLQKIKTFRNGEKANGWTNMLIFGDNLQVLKTLLQMKQEGKLKNADGTPGVRLIYIDPPFATKQEFKGSQDQKAYQDKIAGARFLEILRKRLIFLRDLLSEDGSIFVHLDWKKGHYVKTVMDEIFGEHNFRSEIIWASTSAHNNANNLGNIHQTIFYYAKSGSPLWNEISVPYNDEYIETYFRYKDKEGRRFKSEDLTVPSRTAKNDFEFFGKKPSRKRGWGYSKDEMEKMYRDGRIFITKNGFPRYKRYLDEMEGMAPQSIWADRDVWTIGSWFSERIEYPTQKPESLMKRIIQISSNENDLVMDAFCGGGSFPIAAEKLKRIWIGIDCGKLAIYTVQKRLLNIAESKDLENPKKKYGKLCTPFTLYNAGLYDYKMIQRLPFEQYRDFALKLFQCRDERHEISKIELDGYLGADSVMVFNYQKHPDAMLDKGFIEDLHKYLGEKIGRRFFIIAPAASVQFLEDYIEKSQVKYIVLRIPYSIIEEIHKRGFTKIKQPVCEMDVNDTVDAVGFDFIQAPIVECKYFQDKPTKSDILNQETKECVIRIEKFESKVISRKPLEFANLETLSMVMLDYEYDGEVFDLDEVFYAEELKKNGYEVRFAEDMIKGQTMVIYIDIFGNEKWEVKTLPDFNNRRRK